MPLLYLHTTIQKQLNRFLFLGPKSIVSSWPSPIKRWNEQNNLRIWRTYNSILVKQPLFFCCLSAASQPLEKNVRTSLLFLSLEMANRSIMRLFHSICRSLSLCLSLFLGFEKWFNLKSIVQSWRAPEFVVLILVSLFFFCVFFTVQIVAHICQRNRTFIRGLCMVSWIDVSHNGQK